MYHHSHLCLAGDRAQGFVRAKHALYQPSHTPSPHLNIDKEQIDASSQMFRKNPVIAEAGWGSDRSKA